MLGYQQVHSEASLDIKEYLSNPINGFRLIKRLTTDWKEVETLMLDDVGSSKLPIVPDAKLICQIVHNANYCLSTIRKGIVTHFAI